MKTKKLEIVFAAKFERELQRSRNISRNIRYLESAIQHLRLQGVVNPDPNFRLTHQAQITTSIAFRNERIATQNVELFAAHAELATSRENMRRSFQEMIAVQGLIKRCGE